jgi:hypothetical protein
MDKMFCSNNEITVIFPTWMITKSSLLVIPSVIWQSRQHYKWNC